MIIAAIHANVAVSQTNFLATNSRATIHFLALVKKVFSSNRDTERYGRTLVAASFARSMSTHVPEIRGVRYGNVWPRCFMVSRGFYMESDLQPTAMMSITSWRSFPCLPEHFKNV